MALMGNSLLRCMKLPPNVLLFRKERTERVKGQWRKNEREKFVMYKKELYGHRQGVEQKSGGMKENRVL